MKLPLNGLQIFTLSLRPRQVKLSNTRQEACVLCALLIPFKTTSKANQAEMKCLRDMFEQIILTVLPANPSHYLNTDEYLFILKLIPHQGGHLE